MQHAATLYEDKLLLLSAPDVSRILSFLVDEGDPRGWAALASTCRFAFEVALLGSEDASQRSAAIQRADRANDGRASGSAPACFPRTHVPVRGARCLHCVFLLRTFSPLTSLRASHMPGWHAPHHEEESRRKQLERYLGAPPVDGSPRIPTSMGTWTSIRAIDASARDEAESVQGHMASVLQVPIAGFLSRRCASVTEAAHRVLDAYDLMRAYVDDAERTIARGEEQHGEDWKHAFRMIRELLEAPRRERRSEARWAWLQGCDSADRVTWLQLQLRRRRIEAEMLCKELADEKLEMRATFSHRTKQLAECIMLTVPLLTHLLPRGLEQMKNILLSSFYYYCVLHDYCRIDKLGDEFFPPSFRRKMHNYIDHGGDRHLLFAMQRAYVNVGIHGGRLVRFWTDGVVQPSPQEMRRIAGDAFQWTLPALQKCVDAYQREQQTEAESSEEGPHAKRRKTGVRLEQFAACF